MSMPLIMYPMFCLRCETETAHLLQGIETITQTFKGTVRQWVKVKASCYNCWKEGKDKGKPTRVELWLKEDWDSFVAEARRQ